MHNSLNIIKIISSLNKTLNTVNKILPMYEQVKPLINNFSSLSNIFNIINSNDEKEIIKEVNNEEKKVSNINLPTFFQ